MMSDEIIRVHAVVTGMVQGVGFRYFVVMKTRSIGGLSGWVRNRYDGSVEVEAQGPRGSVAQLISALKVGPRWSQVEHVQVREIPTEGDDGAGMGDGAGSKRGFRAGGGSRRAAEQADSFRVYPDA
ncbi:acylphosphatase [Bifidobacterium stellenboschense]|uniref:Acylphosphatase n=1 Tax=Bifidobacterium stellenboschense TaxID=762211 RepID=A0A087DJI0_9BIFI|nr:acylphosphatase [Bifidobacterium stellenboschense]